MVGILLRMWEVLSSIVRTDTDYPVRDVVFVSHCRLGSKIRLRLSFVINQFLTITIQRCAV
jgi:hypothetical protein